jgi:hypothetical protein
MLLAWGVLGVRRGKLWMMTWGLGLGVDVDALKAFTF